MKSMVSKPVNLRLVAFIESSNVDAVEEDVPDSVIDLVNANVVVDEGASEEVGS